MNNDFFKRFFNKDKLPVYIIFSLLLVIGYQYYDSNNTMKSSLLDIEKAPAITNAKDKNEELVIESNSSATEIYVHISGAVKNPGILKLNNTNRVIDALQKAGGPLEDADLDRINLAKKLSDEEKIYIPKIGEINTNSINTLTSTSNNMSNNLININTADLTELQKIPGVGEKTAEKIINYRNSSPFSSIEDIKNVDGIGDKKFESMKEYISTY